MRRMMLLGLTLFVCPPMATAGLELWSGNPANVDITFNSAVITAAGTFKFQSVTGGNLDVIDDITVADGVTGTVIVYIERDTDDDSPGATNVGAIDLTNNQGASPVGQAVVAGFAVRSRSHRPAGETWWRGCEACHSTATGARFV